MPGLNLSLNLPRCALRGRIISRIVPLAHIIHERFYCNRRYAAATSLAAGFPQPSGRARPSRPRRTVGDWRPSARRLSPFWSGTGTAADGGACP